VLAKARAASERIAALQDATPDVADRPGAFGAPRFAGAIEFRDVSFAYNGSRPAVSAINLRILPGEKIALVGPSGAGKSTLLALVARLIDPSTGMVLLDGRDVRDYRLRSVRDQLSLVLQESLLFSGTVRENVAFGRPSADHDAIVRACVLAEADGFIRELPEGYDTELSERGSTLSGGQRQRLALARAILRDAPLLLLDEPTTGLDGPSEDLVLRALERACQGKTTLLVTHHVRVAQFVDRIVVLDRGGIVDCGSRAEMLARGGFYARVA
jgi:ATP-binding cassette, subfamily B, bacterial